jgi:hypothetical protein
MKKFAELKEGDFFLSGDQIYHKAAYCAAWSLTERERKLFRHDDQVIPLQATFTYEITAAGLADSGFVGRYLWKPKG